MSLLKRCLAEGIGTAALTLVACGVATYTSSSVAISLAFGLVIVAMAYSIGNVSGCHINPAVSLAMALSKKITWKEFGAYVGAQVVGALAGSLILGLFKGGFTALGGNQIQSALLGAYSDSYSVTAGSLIVGFIAEIVLTFIFVIAVLGATDSRHHDGKHAGIVIGLALTLVHLLGLNLTGTSVNPARSLAPALLQAIAGNTTSLSQIWIWILAPMIGGAIAAYVYKYLTDDGKKQPELLSEQKAASPAEAKAEEGEQQN